MKIWIHINGVQEGPYDINSLPLERMTPQTPVWYQGLDYWKEAAKAPAVAPLLQRRAERPQQPMPTQPRPQQPGPANAPTAEAQVQKAAEKAVRAEAEKVAEKAEEVLDYEVSEAAAEVENEENALVDAAANVQAPRQAAADAQQPQPQPQPQPQSDIFVENDDINPDPDAVWAEPQYQERYRSQQSPFAQQPYPQDGYPQQPQRKAPGSYIVWSVLFTILCCNPLGIIPIITGICTINKVRNYQYDEAERSSETTQWWLAITIVTSLIMLPFSVIVAL